MSHLHVYLAFDEVDANLRVSRLRWLELYELDLLMLELLLVLHYVLIIYDFII